MRRFKRQAVKILIRIRIKANLEALEQFKSMSSKISCDFEEKDSFVYSVSNTKKLEDELNALSKIGYPARSTQTLPLPFKVAGAVQFKNQAQFNPLKFISEISNDLHIYENTFINKIIGNHAFTNNGKIEAKKIVVATHFPFINSKGLYFVKMYQHRSYVIAIENAPLLDGMYVDERLKGMSFRNYKDFLFVGGGDHRTGKKGGSFQELRHFIKKYYPNTQEKYLWATQDCMTLDSIPYIGQYSPSSPDLLVATGFNKWGMTSSMVAANILTDLICKGYSKYENVFNPQRNWLKSQLLVNGAEAIINLLTPTTKRCSHLGCALKWNKNEHTWDCPCHGSRFTKKGTLINNPAMRDIK